MTIISGTNRPGSNSGKVARQYQQLLAQKGITTRLINLEEWTITGRSEEFEQLENESLAPAEKFIFVSPEYNGSIPGVLKMMIDQTSYRKVWPGKKALLVGVSTGRAGNLRGMDHLASILGHLGVYVHPNQLPISQVDRLMNGTDQITEDTTLKAIDRQLDQFIAF